MSNPNAQVILAQLRALIPNAAPVGKVNSTRTKRDSLSDARSKVIDKLRGNIAFLNGIGGKVDAVYKEQSNGLFGVGIKYGNRYLVDSIAGGTFLPNVAKEMLPQVLEVYIKQVEDKLHDDAIEKIMRDNVDNRNKEVN